MSQGARLTDQSLTSRSNELVYVFVASRGNNHPTLKQVQNAMRFSSPSSALFHLKKLEEAGIIGRDQYGNYQVKKSMDSPYVSRYVCLGPSIVPKRLLYALVVTSLAWAFSLALSQFVLDELALIALAPNLFSAAVFWFEAWQDWKVKPRF